MSTNIYILRLQGGNYYVGKSTNIMKRYQEHLNGIGSSWTRKYKPIGVEKVVENASPFDEDKYVKEYMAKYGFHRVRGGTYVQEELDDIQEDALKREIWGAQDCCTNCGRKGHFIKDCHATTDVFGNTIDYDSEDESESSYDVFVCEYCGNEYDNERQCENHEKYCGKNSNSRSQNIRYSYSKSQINCYRCGRPGHFASDCYARTDKKGYYIDSDDD